MRVYVITPPVATAEPDTDLVALTEHIWKTYHAGEPYGYGLGGQYGYGCDFENDTFVMRPFWWGECTCSVGDGGEGDHEPICRYVAPNFAHKPSGTECRWYKWIGRSMEWDPEPSPDKWRAIFAECVASVDTTG